MTCHFLLCHQNQLTLTLIFLFTLVVNKAQCTPDSRLLELINLDEPWKDFKLTHSKSYSSLDEEIRRYKIWIDNYQFVEKHNKMAHDKKFNLGLNSFCDLSQSEISVFKYGLKLSHTEKMRIKANANETLAIKKSNKNNEDSSFLDSDQNLKASESFSFNWVDKGFVSPIKDQGTCGACWSFVSTSALESQLRIKRDLKTTLSEQNLIDCSVSYGNEGCDGGLMSQAFSYVRDNNGINPDTSYAYIGSIGKCKYSKSQAVAKVSGYVSLPNDEELLKIAVKTIGPIAIGIDADHKSFTLYKSGIYFEPKCSSESLNHAVLIVGYGTENGEDYWLIKNSWGKSWGENGFGKLARNRKNNCGVASLAGYPLLA